MATTGIIRKLNETELIGGVIDRDVYPITSTLAVFAKTGESLESILTRLNYKGIEDLPIEIITHDDDYTKPTDKNLYSALAVDLQRLRKDKPDTAKKIITFMEGLKVGEYTSKTGGEWKIEEDGQSNLTTDYLNARNDSVLHDVTLDRIHDPKSTPAERVIIGAQGFDLYIGDDDKAHMYLDYLTVRNKAFFSTLEIRKVSYSGGTLLMSNAGSTIVKVVYIFDESGENVVAYKCYAKADDGTTATQNWWKVGMMALCQTFNIKPGVYHNVSNRYYWRLCVGVGQETLDDGKLYDWVILSNVKEFKGSDSIIPSYMLRILVDKNRYLSWGGILVAVNNREDNTSLAKLINDQDYKTKDDWGNVIADRTFYGYEAVDGMEPDAPQVGDVIVNVGDEVSWFSRGNVIKLETSTEDDQSGTAPSMTMYYGIGAPRKTEAGKINVFQWKAKTAIISPAAVQFNANLFKVFTDDPNADPYDPWQKTLETTRSELKATKNEITASVETVSSNLDKTKAEIKVTTDKLTAEVSRTKYDKDGNIINISKAGLATEENYAQLYAQKVDPDGKISKLAEVDTRIITLEKLKREDYPNLTDEQFEKLRQELKYNDISSVRIKGDWIDIDANHKLTINTAGALTITSGNFKLDDKGNITAHSATLEYAAINNSYLNNVVLNGAFISPWVETGTYVNVGTGKVSYATSTNFVSHGEGGWGDGDANNILKWNSADNGRLIRIAAFNPSAGAGNNFKLNAKQGFYFYENGRAKDHLSGVGELLEIVGYGKGSTFYGYIVISRKYIHTEYSHGFDFNPIAYGKVQAGYNNVGPTIQSASFDGSELGVTRLSEGRYKLTFPGLKVFRPEHIMIMVTGYKDDSHLGSNALDNPVKSSVDEIGNGYAIISSSDDNSRNEGGFFFIIYNMYDWGDFPLS